MDAAVAEAGSLEGSALQYTFSAPWRTAARRARVTPIAISPVTSLRLGRKNRVLVLQTLKFGTRIFQNSGVPNSGVELRNRISAPPKILQTLSDIVYMQLWEASVPAIDKKTVRLG